MSLSTPIVAVACHPVTLSYALQRSVRASYSRPKALAPATACGDIRLCLVALAIVLLAGFVPQGRADFPSALANSEYLLHGWGAADGLPEDSATSIVQTRDGYLWFGTFNGLVRYNGDRFTVLNPDNTPELPSAGIVNLHLDKRDRLWVSTYRGLVLREGARWRPLRQPDGTPLGLVRTFSERANGDVFVTTFDGKVYESSGTDLAELPSPPGTQGLGYLGGVDEEGHWWVLQRRFIGRWETNRWVGMLPPLDVPDEALGCAPARDGGLWLLLGRELRKQRRGAVVVRLALPESPGSVWSLSEDSQGNVWIASFNQGFSRVTAGGGMRRWGAADGLSDEGRCVFEDRERNLWLGTSGDGLLRLTHRRFRHFQLTSKSKGVMVHSVSADGTGGIWAATFGQGLFHLNEAGVIAVPPPALSNSSSYLQSVLADRAGRLCVSGMGSGLWVYDQTGTRLVGREKNVIALFQDSKERVWTSAAGGLVTRLDANRIQEFGSSNGLPKDAGTCFAEDSTGAIWIACSSGVFRRSMEGPFTEVRDPSGAALRGVLCLKADREGAVWLGSSDRGLLRCKDSSVAVLDADDGFPVSTVGGIVEDELGCWWMTSGPRLVRARLQDLQAVADRRQARVECQVFGVSDGLPRAEFAAGRQPTDTRDSHGCLWFAMTKGVVMVDPAVLLLNDQPPPVYVEEFSFSRPAPFTRKPSEKLTRNYGAPLPGPVVLPPGSRGLEIRYTALSLTASEKVRFQIKLEGTDTAWQDVEQRRSVSYYELAPARYVFHVRAANNDGVWNEAGTSLAFTVLPFFWQTWWFRVTLAVVLVGLGVWGARLWLRTHLRRVMERERAAYQIRELAGRLINAQEKERARLARELHDDITQRLARLAIDVGQCEQGTTGLMPTETAREVRTGLIQLSQDVHALSYRLHPSILEDLGLTEALRAEIERFERQQSIPVKADLQGAPAKMAHEAALCLFRVAQEALQNIARHAHADTVEISLRAIDGAAQLAVRDDGCGFDPKFQRDRPSLGLASMRERVESVGGELDLESAPGHGTTVLVWVPLTKAEG